MAGKECRMNRASVSAVNYLRIRHLRLLEALVALGSLHKAAATLHVSQPAASAMLQDIEGAFGVTLFERTRRGVVLKPHGAVALARMRTVLSELNMLSEELRSTTPSPVVRVGTLRYVFFGLLQSFLPEFLSQTNCRVDLIEGSNDLVHRLQRNEIDCLIGRMPAAWVESVETRNLFYQPLYEIDMCILAAPSHPLARRRKVGLEDLAGFPWIMQREGSNSRHVLMTAFASAGLQPPMIRIETSSFVFTIPLLAGTDCLTVAPRDASFHQQRLGVACILPVTLPRLLTPMAFIAPQTAMANPNVRLLWETIRKATARPTRARQERVSGRRGWRRAPPP
jgi:DNA-binding transcriptional LysR family regulator